LKGPETGTARNREIVREQGNLLAGNFLRNQEERRALLRKQEWSAGGKGREAGDRIGSLVRDFCRMNQNLEGNANLTLDRLDCGQVPQKKLGLEVVMRLCRNAGKYAAKPSASEATHRKRYIGTT
jgi:hypothetical protein